MKICKGRKKKCIYRIVERGERLGRVRDLYVLVIKKCICNWQVV